jgi:hypothetical protein
MTSNAFKNMHDGWIVLDQDCLELVEDRRVYSPGAMEELAWCWPSAVRHISYVHHATAT